ncbi:MAG: response regulator [Rhodospirillales bacterium]|nr:response regulator [Rhodospirillales bacterium]
MNKKILIVDDEPHIRSLIEQTLEYLEDEHGFEILSATNGEEGLATIRSEKPALVFLDVMMPLMNGYAVCRKVKEEPDLAGTIIVLLTAKGQEVDRQVGIEAGAHRYMTKPFDPDELLGLAKGILGLE